MGHQVFSTEALPSWPRSPCFAAPGLGGASCAPRPTRPGWGAPLSDVRRLRPPKRKLHLVAAKPACLNAAETRETVKSRHLLEPFAALKFAGAQRKAEALSAKLCRTGDDFVYEITLLHRDGRLVHVEMEAGTGKIGSRPSHEPHEAHEPHEPHETSRGPRAARQELISAGIRVSRRPMRLLVVEDDRDLNRQVSHGP